MSYSLGLHSKINVPVYLHVKIYDFYHKSVVDIGHYKAFGSLSTSPLFLLVDLERTNLSILLLCLISHVIGGG